MNTRIPVLFSLVIFASFWTTLAIVGFFQHPTVIPPGESGGHPGQINPIFGYSIPISATAWVAIGLIALQGKLSGLRRSSIRGIFAKRGFEPDVYDLMVGMRGSGSRVSLLQNLDSPRHRLELSERTGIDWKEVDRQISVLEKYGLVKVYAQSGTVRLYQVTESGKLLLNLITELNNGFRKEPRGEISK